MTSDDLTVQQAQALLNRVSPMLAYLHELRSHIDYRRFPPDDRLRTLVNDAYNAVHALNAELHYMTCRKVGRSTRRPHTQPQPHGD
jgi:hypothetical protein